jgi:anion-transporting  ArsA/GET3 family ATPase
MSEEPIGLEALVASHRIIVCCGSGGVGKTTTAASVALWGARSGRRSIVLTIDPARRLADSLGIGPLGNTPRAVERAWLDRAGVTGAGSLTAMMLDQKGSWDELIARHAPTPEVRDRILENSFYRQLSQSFAGSQEYMAVEQLGALDASGQYDLIVVDTPPTQHALDFLEAPERLLHFLDRKIVRWFVKPSFTAGWSTLQTMNRTVGFLFHKIEDATGVAALAQVSDFFQAMGGLFDGFEARVARVTELLRDPATAFLLVAGPDEQVLGQAEYLVEQMSQRGMPLKGVVMNRVHPCLETDGDEELDEAAVGAAIRPWVASALGRRRGASGDVERVVGDLARNFLRHQARARGDAVRMEVFRGGLPEEIPVAEVPDLTRDVHDLGGLFGLHRYLFRSDQPV